MNSFFGDRVNILVIDDSDIIRTSLRNFLSEYDLEVVTCNDGLEGIQKAIEYKPKLIFLDLMMPNLDGLRMLKVIKILEDIKNLPVIVISGHTDKNNVISALQAGAVKVISKPLNKDVLIRSINEVLGKDFLHNSKKIRHLTDAEKGEMNKQLKKYFFSSLDQRKETLQNSVTKKNIDLLKTVLHELKSSSAMIGFINLSNLCKDFESSLQNGNGDWSMVEKKVEEILEEFSVLEMLNSK